MPESFIGAIPKPRKHFVVCLSGTFVFVLIRDRKIKHAFFFFLAKSLWDARIRLGC